MLLVLSLVSFQSDSASFSISAGSPVASLVPLGRVTSLGSTLLAAAQGFLAAQGFALEAQGFFPFGAQGFCAKAVPPIPSTNNPIMATCSGFWCSLIVCSSEFYDSMMRCQKSSPREGAAMTGGAETAIFLPRR